MTLNKMHMVSIRVSDLGLPTVRRRRRRPSVLSQSLNYISS